MSNKKGFEISFAWLFAILLGIFILFFAIFSTVRFANIGQYQISAETAKRLGILLNPLETGFETAKVTTIELSSMTRLYNLCDDEGTFGRQGIRISQESFGKWPEPAEGSSFMNKYIFSTNASGGNVSEGRTLYVFSKPFEFPFKVADLIYITSTKDKYCFIDPPSSVEDELAQLNLGNIILEENKNKIEQCPDKSVKVCFDFQDNGCDIFVDENEGSIGRKGISGRVNFGGDSSLRYGAIFSSKEIYECQVKRLMKRAREISSLYLDQSNIISSKGCDSNLGGDLLIFGNFAGAFEDSEDLALIIPIIERMEIKNENLVECELW